SNFPPPAHSGKSAAGQALSLTGSAPAPCPGGQATGLDSSTARYTVTPPRLRSPPAGPFPCLSVFVRARPARGAELLPLSRPGVSARGRGARGEGLWAGASGPRGRRRGPPPGEADFHPAQVAENA